MSRQAIDIIQIAGLVAGAIGVFYLSQGLFGRIGNDVLRLFLIALPLGVVGAFAEPLAVAADPNIITFHIPMGFLWLAGFCGFFLVGLLVGSPIYRSTLEQFRPLFIVGATVLIFLIVLIYRLYFFHLSFQHASVEAGLDAASFACGFGIPKLAIHMSERQLQFVGLALTLLGIATQFLSPVLDLLNIRVQ